MEIPSSLCSINDERDLEWFNSIQPLFCPFLYCWSVFVMLQFLCFWKLEGPRDKSLDLYIFQCILFILLVGSCSLVALNILMTRKLHVALTSPVNSRLMSHTYYLTYSLWFLTGVQIFPPESIVLTVFLISSYSCSGSEPVVLGYCFFSHIHICLSNSLNYCSYVTSCTKKVHVLTPVASLCLSPFDFLPESFFSQYPHILPKCPCSSPCLLCFSQDTRYISHILTSFRSVKLSDGPLILPATCTALCYFEVLKAI